jgi:phage head maturation protease
MKRCRLTSEELRIRFALPEDEDEDEEKETVDGQNDEEDDDEEETDDEDESSDEEDDDEEKDAQAQAQGQKEPKQATGSMPRFRVLAYTGGKIRVSGWQHPVVVDLAGLEIPSQKIPVRFNHDPNSGIGHTTKIAVVESALVAEGVISRSTAAAMEVIESAKKGFPWQASVGLSVEDYEEIDEDEDVEVNGSKFTGPLIVISRSILDEISFVDLGADRNTTVSVAANRSITMTTNEQPTSKSDTSAKAIIARAKAERRRLAAIRALIEEAASSRHVDIELLERIAAQAEEEGWDVQRTELEILRATRPRVKEIGQRQKTYTPAVIEAALCLSCGIPDERLAKDRDYGEKVVEQAWPLRRRGLLGMLSLALEASGVRVPYNPNELYDTIVQMQRSPNLQAAGFSTVNLPGILGNVANKILLDAFTQQPVTYDQIAAIEDFSNFHVHNIYRLDATGSFVRVPHDGELPHGQLVESAYTNKLDTYGMMLTITRQQIVNDDLGAFKSLIAQLGRRARIALERALYNVVMEATDNFYSAANGNRLTSAPLGIDSIGRARAALSKMLDANGDPLAIEGQYILVPPELEPLALQIYTSMTLNETTEVNRPRPVNNPYVNRYKPISSPFLSSGSGAGQSPTTWYMIANPSLVPAFQVAFLEGRRAPTIETADTEFRTLGLSMRAYWDFGVARIDPRGAIKATA